SVMDQTLAPVRSCQSGRVRTERPSDDVRMAEVQAMAMLARGRVVTPDGLIGDGWVQTDGRTITALGAGTPPRPADRDLQGAWVVPGFVDMHVHGGGGAAYPSGDQDEAVVAAALHRRHGTTTTMASLVTGEPDGLVRAVGALAELVDEGLLAGIHL